MTSTEFNQLRSRIVREFAAEQVNAGNWHTQDAEQLAAKELRRLLPEGLATPGMLLLTATIDDTIFGHVWIATAIPDAPEGEAWIYDIAVKDDLQGRGYGRQLLRAAERTAKEYGATALGLNVFGTNDVARSLYESSGYEVKTLQMHKPL